MTKKLRVLFLSLLSLIAFNGNRGAQSEISLEEKIKQLLSQVVEDSTGCNELFFIVSAQKAILRAQAEAEKYQPKGSFVAYFDSTKKLALATEIQLASKHAESLKSKIPNVMSGRFWVELDLYLKSSTYTLAQKREFLDELGALFPNKIKLEKEYRTRACEFSVTEQRRSYDKIFNGYR